MLILPSAKEFYSFELADFINSTNEEIEAMIQLNQASADWLKGKIDTATYTDILSFHNIDAEKHLQDTDWYLDQLIRQNRYL